MNRQITERTTKMTNNESTTYKVTRLPGASPPNAATNTPINTAAGIEMITNMRAMTTIKCIA